MMHPLLCFLWRWRGSRSALPLLQSVATKRTLTRVRVLFSGTLVEMEGFEPSSAQGNHTLSTRLFQTSFSSADKTWTTNRHLIL